MPVIVQPPTDLSFISLPHPVSGNPVRFGLSKNALYEVQRLHGDYTSLFIGQSVQGGTFFSHPDLLSRATNKSDDDDVPIVGLV